jgi:hypothetical protein
MENKSSTETKEMWVVCALKKSHPVQAVGREVNLPLDWAPGMVGVLPVFETYADAKRYAGDSGKYGIMMIQEVPNVNDNS